MEMITSSTITMMTQNPEPTCSQLSPVSKSQPSPDSRSQPSPDSKSQPSPDSKSQPSPGSKSQPSADSKSQPSPGSKSQPSPDSRSQSSLDSKTLRKSHVKQYMLPPCRVCGAPGSGLHYGVNTCEACKGFFRRSLKHKGEYACRKGESCRLTLGKKNMCPRCRKQKCVDVGMSVEGIKTGRYSLTRHRDNTVAVKQMAARRAESRQREGDNKQRVMQHLVHNIVDTHKQLFSNAVAELEQLERAAPGIIQDFVERRRQNEDVFGPLKPVTFKEFHQILEGTGIEVDDRLDMWTTWTAPAKSIFAKKAKFCKVVPGFKELPLEDQMTLFKGSVLDGWLIMRHNSFDVDHRCILRYPDQVYEINKMLGEEYADDILRVVRRFQRLKLCMKERVMLMSFCLLSPDRPGLQERERIAALQDQLLEPLLWLLRTNRPDDPLVFAKIVSALTELRSVEDLRDRDILEMISKMASTGRMQLPDIVREIYSL